MMLNIIKKEKANVDESVVALIRNVDDLEKLKLTKTEFTYAQQKFADDSECLLQINSYFKWTYVKLVPEKSDNNQNLEILRKAGADIVKHANKNKIELLNLVDYTENSEFVLSLAEGIVLGNYKFIKYFTKDLDKKNLYLKTLNVIASKILNSDLEQFVSLMEGVYFARNLVNEPLSHLTARKLADNILLKGKEVGLQVEVLDKKQIESLKMGGVLAVNRGSIDPPTFTILEWNPNNAVNTKPYVLVGKGVVFDTGGINLKPGNYMDTMKSDKAGAAAVAGTMYALAKSKLPVHVIGLIPATDNRPGENAYVPQDVITMMDGSTVEVLNTDAEGRMILADALAYAKRYKPELVIDLATLTGAAVVAVGTFAIAAMTNAPDKISAIVKSGFNTYERIVELPLWEEFNEQLKSDVADIKNIGGRYGGAITAGKFLEHFTDYPWVHLDIAGPAYLDAADSYRGKNGTGSGVRLLYAFFNDIVKS
jgi:leucyl aminopeptidase